MDIYIYIYISLSLSLSVRMRMYACLYVQRQRLNGSRPAGIYFQELLGVALIYEFMISGTPIGAAYANRAAQSTRGLACLENFAYMKLK